MKSNLPTIQKLFATIGMLLVMVIAIFGKDHGSLVTAAVFGMVIAVASYCAKAEAVADKVEAKLKETEPVPQPARKTGFPKK